MIDRTLYTAYYDPNSDRPLPDKLAFAASQYVKKHGRAPTTALLHDEEYESAVAAFEHVEFVVGCKMALVRAGDHALHISPAPFVSRHSIYVGVEDAKEDQTEMSTATVDRLLDQAMDEHATPPLDTSPGAWNDKPRHLGEERIPTVTKIVGGNPVTIPAPGKAPTTDTTIVLPIPTEQAFFGADFLADPHLQRLADTLCARHDLPAKDNVTILWKGKGGRSGGKDTLGKCVATSSGLLGHYAPRLFHVWIAADHARTHQLTPKQLEALVYHELSHVGIDCDEGTGECKRTLVGHDFAGFLSELDIYGAWDDTLATAKASFEQARLW